MITHTHFSKDKSSPVYLVLLLNIFLNQYLEMCVICIFPFTIRVKEHLIHLWMKLIVKKMKMDHF